MATLTDNKSSPGKSKLFIMKYGKTTKSHTNTPNFETINLIKINLPHNQKSAIRVSLDTVLSRLFELICAENGFNQTKYKLVIKNEKFLKQPDMNKPLSHYDTNEVYLLYANEDGSSDLSKYTKNKSKSTTNLFFDDNNNQKTSTFRPTEKPEKLKSGILGLFMRKRSKSRASMNDENNTSVRSDAKKVPKDYEKRDVLLNYNLNENTFHYTKKKQAPAPPSQMAQLITRQTSSSTKPAASDTSDNLDRLSVCTLNMNKKKAPAPPPPGPSSRTSASAPTSPSLLSEKQRPTTIIVPKSPSTSSQSSAENIETANRTNPVSGFNRRDKDHEMLNKSVSSASVYSTSSSNIDKTENKQLPDVEVDPKPQEIFFQKAAEVESNTGTPLSSKHSSTEDLSKSFASVIKEAERYIAAAITSGETQYALKKEPRTKPEFTMIAQGPETKTQVEKQNRRKTFENELKPKDNPDLDFLKSSNIEEENFILSKKTFDLVERDLDSDSVNENSNESQEKLQFTPKIDNHETYRVVRSADVFEKDGTFYSYDGTVRGHLGSVKKMTNSKRLSNIFGVNGTDPNKTDDYETVSIKIKTSAVNDEPKTQQLSMSNTDKAKIAPKTTASEVKVPEPTSKTTRPLAATKQQLTPTNSLNQAKPIMDNIRSQIINNRKSLADIINEEKRAVQLKKINYEASISQNESLQATKTLTVPVKPSESFVISAKTKDPIIVASNKPEDFKLKNPGEARNNLFKQIMSSIPNVGQDESITKPEQNRQNRSNQSPKTTLRQVRDEDKNQVSEQKPDSEPDIVYSKAAISPPNDDEPNQTEHQSPVLKPESALPSTVLSAQQPQDGHVAQKPDPGSLGPTAKMTRLRDQRDSHSAETNSEESSVNSTTKANKSQVPPPIAPKNFTLKPPSINTPNKLKSSQAVSMYSNRSSLLDSIKSFNTSTLRKQQHQDANN
jgi:hypothetical protein